MSQRLLYDISLRHSCIHSIILFFVGGRALGDDNIKVSNTHYKFLRHY